MSFALKKLPYASANISGNSTYPKIKGNVYFYEMYGGTYVEASFKNLPEDSSFHGFHIHDGSRCIPMMEGGHYNPTNQLHPQHAGDLPSVLSNDGMAYITFYTNRFYPEDIVGKVVVLHEQPDDFKSQPSGNPGRIIACGEIKEV